MMSKKINKPSNQTNVLLVALDWGLGHATRCIPIIREFSALGCNVIIAAETSTKALLQTEFQELTFVPLKGYRVSYSRHPALFPLKILSQLPGILWSIYQEHAWVKKTVKEHSIHAIISDNRFGLFHSTTPSIYITHQLLIKTGSKFSEKILQEMHYWFIRKYRFCWVPDFEEENNLAGELSHPAKRPANVSYIGCLSRLEKKERIEKKYDLLILLSGPEPQRTIFENDLLNQLKNYKGRSLLVRGLPGNMEPAGQEKTGVENLPNLTTSNHLSAEELNIAIQQADLVISRSEYTTVMDLIKLNQPAILVPTPGQTEQEYLAKHLMNQQLFYSTTQQGFSLAAALKHADEFPFAFPVYDMEQFKKAIAGFVHSLWLNAFSPESKVAVR